jgi:hypothetical protein
MRRVTLGVAVSVVVATVFISSTNPGVLAQVQQLGQSGAPAVKPVVWSDGMIAFASDTVDGRQQVTVIDTKARVMCVYHAEHTTGVISLKSVRNLSADLMMDEFNTDSPLPSEIRKMGEIRKMLGKSNQ